MIRNCVLMILGAIKALAHDGFNIDSLVLTDGPCTIELITEKADAQLKFVKDLDQALKQASVENKEVLVIIVGGANCVWSEKLLFDVIYQPEFYTKAQQDYILCKLELEDLSSKGQELGLGHDIHQLPMLVLMTKDGTVIAEKGDVAEEPKEVIGYLSQAMSHAARIKKALASSGSVADSSLEELYTLAKAYGLKSEAQLYEMGIAKKKNLFFQLEKYQKLLTSGSSKEIKDLKLDIQRLDPRNAHGAIRKLAILDFEDRSRQKKGMDNPFSALKPLFEYLRDYGHYDKECRWEIEMRIARFLFSKNQLQAAIQHASRSLEWAPDSKKSEVFDAVEFLKKQKGS